MNKIIISSTEISIGGVYYPLNTIYFKAVGNNVRIYNLEGEMLYNDVYSTFVNSSI